MQSCTSFEAADTAAAEPVSSENGAGVADTVQKKARAGAVASTLGADAAWPLSAGSFIVCAVPKAFLAKDRSHMSDDPLSASRPASPQCIGPFTGTAAAAACLSASPLAVDAHVQGVGHASLQCESVDSDSD